MVGPKSVCRKGRGRGSAGLARLRHEFHRFREEVGCIRSLPSLHRRWPSLARLEIDSEASSEDGTLWDSEDLTHGIFTPAIASSKTEVSNKRVSVHNLQASSDSGFESACSTHGLKQLCANAQTSSVQFDESSAKCANDWESEKAVAQFKDENLCNVVQSNALVPHRQAAESLGGLESNSNSDDREHFEEGNDHVEPISPCLDSAIFQDASETLHNAVALPDSQLELLEEERNCPVVLLHGPGENVAEAQKSVEEVGDIGPHLTKDSIRAIGACDVNEKLVELHVKQEINGPGYTGGTLRLRFSEFDLRHDKDADQPIVCSSTWGATKTIGDPSLSSYDTTFTGFRSTEACYHDETVDDTFSHSGARVAATAYFTANPRHKHDEKSSVAHRHMTCQNEVDIPSPNVFTSASREEAEFGNLEVLSDCKLENHICSVSKLITSPPGRRQASPLLRINSLEERDVTDDEKDTRTHETQVNVSSVFAQSVSPEDTNRTLKLVGYVYEEVPPKIAQVPDQLVSSKPSSLSGSKSVESLCMEFDNHQIVHASVRPAALYVQRRHGLVEAEERAAVNDLTPCPSQSMTSVVTAPEEERNGKLVERQGGGTSSLIALSGLESLTRLGDECKRDSGLAARMATRIRHALETVGERSRVNDKSKKSYPTEVTGDKGPVDKGLFVGYRARTGIGSSKIERKLRFKTDSDQPKSKIIGGDSHREGWFSFRGTGAATPSSYSVRPEEPETYLQHVIAALDSGNESDVREESDLQQDLSASSEESPEKHANCLRGHHRARSISPRGNTDEGTDLSCLKSRNAGHDYHCPSGTFPQLQSHMAGRTCCPTVVNQELLKQRHSSNGCIGSPKLSGMNRRSVKSQDVDVPRVIRNSCKDEPSIHEADSANPQSFSVKISGSTVEIEVGEEPPSIIWTPRGETDQSVAVLTSSFQSHDRTEDADKNPPGAATSLSPKRNSTQVLLEPCDYMDPNVTQTNEYPPDIRFRDPLLPGKVSKSVRFHSAAKDSGQDKFYGPKKIRESFDRTVESLARKAQGLGGTEANGEAVAGRQPPARLQQGWVQASGVRVPPDMKSKRRLSAPSRESYVNHESLDSKTVETVSSRNRHGVVVPVAGDTQGEETCCSILKGPRGASESDSEVQQRRQGGRKGSQLTGSIRRSESGVASPAEIKVRRPTRRSILKIPRKEASSSSDCTSSVYHGEGCVSDTDERKEILGAAAAGLANELQVLMRSRIPEYGKNQGELRDEASTASEVHASRQRLRTHRSNKLPGHFQPRQQALSPQEFPGISNELTGRSQPVYHSSHGLPTPARRNRLTGHFRSDYEAGCSYLSDKKERKKEPLGQSSSFTKEPLGKLHSFTKPQQPQSISQNRINVLAGGEGRDRFAYHEAQRQSQSLNSARMKRAKQIVRDTLGDVFDYDRFQQELGELASERKRVEWLGKSLVVLKPDAMEVRQKQNRKQQTVDPEKIPNPGLTSGSKEESGSSGNKRHRSTISPLRESGKKMFRSDSGKKAFTIEPNADNQLFRYPADLRDAGIRNITRLEVLSLGGSYSFGHNIRRKTHESQVLPTLQDASISKNPPRKLVPQSKACVKEAGSTKDIEFPTLEKNYITIMEGGESDRPFGDQLAIKRKSLRPPGSIFKVATPVSWFPGSSMSNRRRKKEMLSSAIILEPSGTVERAEKSTLTPKNGNTAVGKMVSDGVSRKPREERRSLLDADCPELQTHKISDFSSDLRKWLLTPSGFDLNDQKDSALKPDLHSVGSKATEPRASRSKTDERTLERQSWSERMKAFLVSCGALLTETNTSKHRRHSKPPSFTTGLGVHNAMEKEEGLVSLGLPKKLNDEHRVKKLDRRMGRLDNARNKLRFTSDVETSPGIERRWASPRKSTGLRNVDKFDSGKKLLVKKTKLGRNVVEPKRGHDLLLTMLNKVSSGITKQKQMVKPVSFQNASGRKMQAPDALGKYASALTSLKVKERARLATTNRVRDVSKVGSKKLRLVEVKGADDCALLRRSKGETAMHTSPGRVLDIKSEGAKYQNNTMQARKNMEGSPTRRDSNHGIQFIIKEMTGSEENWLNVSGGFEFLDSAYEDKKGLRKQNLSSTAPKSSDFRSSSDRTSLHSWSMRSAEVGVPEAFAPVSVGKQSLQKGNSKGSQHNISPVSCMSVQSGSLHQGLLSERRKDVRTERSSSPQELRETSPRVGVNTTRNDNSSLLQISLRPPGLSDFDSDPLDSFLQVFQEYSAKPEVRGSMTHGITGCRVDSQVCQKVNCFDCKSLKKTSSCDTGTRSSSAAEDKLTESEELELALLELVIKTVLRDDLIKNAKSVSVPPKTETTSLATDKRKHQRLHVDKGVQALVLDLLHDVKQLSPTRQASDSTKSSDWPDYTCLAETNSRSESCDDDGDWPEYLGLDEQTGIVEGIERDSPVTKGSSGRIPEPEAFHDTSTMTEPLQASTTSPVSSLPTYTSEDNDRQFVPFQGLASIAVPCLPTQQSKGGASYIVDRSSTGVQANELSVAQPLNSLYLLPLYCLTDGRPLLTPYSTYPHNPVPEVLSHNQPMPIPPCVRGVLSHAKVAAISENDQGTSDNHPSRTEELPVSSQDNESRLVLERESSSSSSSDGSLSSPRTPSTPSTPISSPEHEARVASALAHQRRTQKRRVPPFSPDAVDDANKRKGENEDRQKEQKVEHQQLVVSTEEPPAVGGNLYAKGQKEYPVQQHTGSTLDNQLSGELVPRSFAAASPRTRKELDGRPFVYYDDTGSAELADSYDGSGSSDVSVYPRMYSGLDVPFASIEALAKLNSATASVSVIETRAPSPGEAQHPALASVRQADGLRANPGRYPLGGHHMYRERDLTRSSGVAREQGLPFSEGEIEAGGLGSEGECGRMCTGAGVFHHNFLHTSHQHAGEVSEPGEVSRFGGQQIIKTKSPSVEKGSLIQSLSEGEIRADMIKRAEMNTASGSVEERSSSE